jgi:hypothetical protein
MRPLATRRRDARNPPPACMANSLLPAEVAAKRDSQWGAVEHRRMAEGRGSADRC